MALLIDYSQILIASATHSDISAYTQKGIDPKIIRQAIMNSFFRSMMYYNRVYRPQYGAPIICADSKDVWRKNVFEYYKAHRKAGKEESPLDWTEIYTTMDYIRTVLDEIFPWKVVKTPGAEGDDIIACLCKYFQDNEEKDHGLFVEPQDILIISSDGDFGQLRKYKNVSQWNPMQKKLVEKPGPTALHDKIVRGDGGDGVPSVLNEDHWLTIPDRPRAKPVTVKIIEKFNDYANLTDEEKRRYDRNKQLISFDCIPAEIESSIINTYKTASDKKDLGAVMNFFIANRVRDMLDRLQEL